MRPILKVGLAILAIFGLLQAVWFSLLVEPTGRWAGQLWQWQQMQPGVAWFGVGLAVLAGVVFLALLLLAVFKRSTTSQLSVSTDRGQLNLSRSAIEKSVKYAVQQQHSVTDVQVKVQLRKNAAATAQVAATVLQKKTDMVGTSKAIEVTAKNELATRLGVPVKKVNVHLLTADQRKRPVADVI
ncbi:alkaline shock response membrane anchor protein AmaP [Loigolactobacillus jiayinensis]|uniref:Alkaline shock response membrane anchor protein AmaP n=1 Tax=Loigolactobacillus jiayinensis TaxID=2486016 RepID=A0ABW1RF61_9LACO|nr:alkaline shock response membrane anchor protein AmaP [Loigolactobacillus jiayinensis]